MTTGWRTVVAMGFWTATLWAIGVGWVYLQPQTHAALQKLPKRIRELLLSSLAPAP